MTMDNNEKTITSRYLFKPFVLQPRYSMYYNLYFL